VIVEIVVSIEGLLVILTRLHLTTIALLPKAEIEIVALHTYPVLIGMLY